MDYFNKVVYVGLNKEGSKVFCRITYANRRLSITGVEGPLPGGGCKGSCGQIVMSDWDIKEYGDGWNDETVLKFREVWNRWHLNDMIAGTPKQEEYLRDNHISGSYAERCEALSLLIDHNYKYGTAWMFEPVPEDTLLWLMNLPNSKLKPAWA